MKTKAELLSRLREVKIMAVVRANSPGQAVQIARALLEGGVLGIEITFSTPDAPRAIQELGELSAKGSLAAQPLLGAGTVLTPGQVQSAFDAGAQFFVSPCTIPSVIEAVQNLPEPRLILPGALTPTEIFEAHSLGGDVIKVFPAARLGVAYFDDLRGPLPHIPLMPTGGVDVHNARQWLQAGAVAIGAGSNIQPKTAIASGNWSEISRLARELVEAIK